MLPEQNLFNFLPLFSTLYTPSQLADKPRSQRPHNRHFSVVPYFTICPSTETYFGLYLRGAMSAVTGINLFRLQPNIIFFALRYFFTLTNSKYPDEMPHDGISPVCMCKKNMYRKIYFTIEMQPNIVFKVISCSIYVCIHLL